MITEEFVTGLTIAVAVIVTALMVFLTVKIYLSEEPKQRASIEPEVDDNTELT